jgi:hypothetical protein
MEDTDKILKQAADYVAITQPLIDKQAAAQDLFVKQAQKTVAILVNRGIVPEAKQSALLDKFASDHAYALVMMEKMAAAMGTENLGGPSAITKQAEDKVDPFVREFLPELLKSNVTI